MIYAAGVLFVGFFVMFLVPALAEVATRIADSGDEWIAELNAWTTETFGFPVDNDVASSLVSAGRETDQFVQQEFGTLAGLATGGITLIFNLATIAMFTFYFTADAPRVKRAVLRLFAPETQHRIGWTWDQAIIQTGGYFYSRLILMAINGTGFALTMALVGMPITLLLPLAVFAGFVSVFIPAIGTYIGSAVPVLVTLGVQGFIPA